jgi:hypothetical protein
MVRDAICIDCVARRCILSQIPTVWPLCGLQRAHVKHGHCCYDSCRATTVAWYYFALEIRWPLSCQHVKSIFPVVYTITVTGDRFLYAPRLLTRLRKYGSSRGRVFGTMEGRKVTAMFWDCNVNPVVQSPRRNQVVLDAILIPAWTFQPHCV